MNDIDPAALDAAAARLTQAALTGRPCAPVRDLIGEGDIAAAYAVQDRLTRAALEAGRRIVGRKVGLTSPAVQAQLGVDQPDYGVLFADMDVPCGDDIAFGALLQPRCEAEIAFILGQDLDDEHLFTGDILQAVDWVTASIEVVDSRIAGWDIKIADTIADNGSSGRFVLSPAVRRIDQVDLIGCGMMLDCGGEVVSSGAGIACLGSPVNAALWLARAMARSGRPLRKGEVVLTGALGPMVAARPGDRFEAHIEGLGSVSVGFSEETA